MWLWYVVGALAIVYLMIWCAFALGKRSDEYKARLLDELRKERRDD